MVSSHRRAGTVLLIFLALTLILTFPIAFRSHEAVSDFGDPLLNIWILTWDIEQVVHGNLSGFFDGNIFFPHQRTLAYSEMLLPQALLAALPLLLTGNRVLAYNFVLLASFLFSAIGMYGLAYRLTKSGVASVVAGMIFAFSPFMFDHTAHLQIFFAGGIPLTLLFLSRFLQTEAWRDLLLLALFFVIQLLGNCYYAVYLSYAVALLVLVHLVTAQKWRDRVFCAKLAALAGFVVALAGPVFWQYLRFQQEMGFSREINFQAKLASYVTTPRSNLVYGGMLFDQNLHEARLFPGILPVLLGIVGFAVLVSSRLPDPVPQRRLRRAWRLVLAAAIALCLLAIAAILVAGRFKVELLGLKITGSHLNRPFFLLLFLLALFASLDAGFRARWLPPLTSPAAWIRYCAYLGMLAFILSFGTHGPYMLLYHFAPGFAALRSVARIHIINLLALAVIAAWGVRWLLAQGPVWRRQLFRLAIPGVILIEYLNFPLVLRDVPRELDVPPVYRFLATQPPGTSLLELPLGNLEREFLRMYFATFHWQPLVNGVSGYIPPVNHELVRRWQSRSAAQVIGDAQDLGVRYLVLHRGELSRRDRVACRALLWQQRRILRFVDQFRNDEVWEIAPREAEDTSPLLPPGRPLDRDHFVLSSSRPQDLAHLLDGKLSTFWHSGGPQRVGDWLTVDLGTVVHATGMTFLQGRHFQDFPRSYQVEGSSDGVEWTSLTEAKSYLLPIRHLLAAKTVPFTTTWEPVPVRFLRLTLTRADPKFFWSAFELEVYSAAGSAQPANAQSAASLRSAAPERKASCASAKPAATFSACPPT